MRLIFDCETSGLWRDSLPSHDPAQPNIVQIAAHLYDGKWTRHGAMKVLVRPNGWTIEPQAQAVHGITLLQCERYGLPLVAVLAMFRGMVDCAMEIVAYNLQGFDRRLITAALAKAGSNGQWWTAAAPRMRDPAEMATPVLAMPGEFGLKIPSLREAISRLAPDYAFTDQHDAEADLLATAEVYRRLTK